ncbi:uncharacterized protein [Aegilops tauschii subsp. strangulata]|uniref:uncharacterized protein isoform X2 n=1 Tax=Aegilops tauschii subsp. strangulata TaxID=200361 RepID=UPI003CC83DDB
MDRYQRVEKPRPEAAAISENEIRITTQGLIRNYVTYATSLLQEKRVKEIVLKAMGQAISKTVAITEIIKKRIPGLHQDTTISSVSITDVWEPIEEGLVPLEMTRHVSMISISLSPKELDTNSPGYQAPLHAEPLKPRYQQVQRYQQQHQPRQNQVQTDSYVRGRGRGRGRGLGGRGGYGGGYGGYDNNQGGYGGYSNQGGYGHNQGGYGNQGGYSQNQGGYGGGYGYDQGGYGGYDNGGWNYNQNRGRGGGGRGRGNWGYSGPGYERGGRGAGGPGGRGYVRGRGRMGPGRGRGNQNY